MHAKPDKKVFSCRGSYSGSSLWHCCHLCKVSARCGRLLDSVLEVDYRLSRIGRRGVRVEKTVQCGFCDSEFQELARARFFSCSSLHFFRFCRERYDDLECDFACEHDSILLSSRFELHVQKRAFSHPVRGAVSIVHWGWHNRACCRRSWRKREFVSQCER